MKRQFFGTDGMRGKAGKAPLDPPTIYALGLALGHRIRETSGGGEVLLGMDTRESGPWMAATFGGGLAKAGVPFRSAGLISTPGVAWLTRTKGFAAGVMISASHNAYEDNGIKVIGASGYKLPDAEEFALEQEMLALLVGEPRQEQAELTHDAGLDEEYLAFLASTMPEPLSGLRLVLDCANGAVSHLAPSLFERLGASVEAISHAPDGRNINANCGAVHVENLQQAVVDMGADAGLAFDGDADRLMMIAASGRVVDGDEMLWIAARDLHNQRNLVPEGIAPHAVATLMSNLGLEKALASQGIGLERTAVGDRYVLEAMLKGGSRLGGEQSGHVIFHQYATTGDGMLTGLRILEVMRAQKTDLESLSEGFVRHPQRLVNVKVRERRPMEELPPVWDSIEEAKAFFGGAGRVFVRYSGTEALARVMVEGLVEHDVNLWAHRIAEKLEREIGLVPA